MSTSGTKREPGDHDEGEGGSRLDQVTPLQDPRAGLIELVSGVTSRRRWQRQWNADSELDEHL